MKDEREIVQDDELKLHEVVVVIAVVALLFFGIGELFDGDYQDEVEPARIELQQEEERISEQYGYMKEYTFEYTTPDEYMEVYDINIKTDLEHTPKYFILLNGEGYEGYSVLLDKNTEYTITVVFFELDHLAYSTMDIDRLELEVNDEYQYTPYWDTRGDE